MPNIDLAEKILHYKFEKDFFKKEFFQLNIEEAILIAEEVLNDFFKKELIIMKAIELSVQLKKIK